MFHFRPTDRLILEPRLYKTHMHNPSTPKNDASRLKLLQPWVTSTASSRSASATCHEARQIVLELLPNTIKFQLLPYAWRNGPGKNRIHLDRTTYPEYTLRFSRCSGLSSSSTPTGKTKRPLQTWFINQNLTWLPSPRCVTLVSHSADSDGNDAIWTAQSARQKATVSVRLKSAEIAAAKKFLCALSPAFPRLTRSTSQPFLKIFGRTRRLNILEKLGRLPQNSLCSCPGRDGVKPRHSWPIIASPPEVCGWLVIYDDRAGCFPKFKAIESVGRDTGCPASISPITRLLAI